MKKLNVAIIMGGISSEREVSLASGRNVFRVLKSSKKYFPISIEIEKNGKWVSGKNKVFLNPKSLKVGDQKVNVCFIALHGPYGEDGTIQGLLEMFKIPYTGSGVLASALGIDKLASKRIFKASGLPIAKFKEVYFDKYIKSPEKIIASIIRLFGNVFVIKPKTQGSSIGVSIIRLRSRLKGENQVKKALKEAFKYDEVILIEEYIKGREIQVGILGNKNLIALPPIKIISKRNFFDYQAKYDSDLAEEIVPAKIDEKETFLVQNLALGAYKSLGCKGFARVDMFLNTRGKVLVSEVNTIPGLTKNSLFPKEAKAAGIEFLELAEKIIDLALEK